MNLLSFNTLAFFVAFFFLSYDIAKTIVRKLNWGLYSGVATIISFTSIWFIFNLSYYFKLSEHIISYITSILIFVWILYRSIHRETEFKFCTTKTILALMIILPHINTFGNIFTAWDAVVSWNSWALQLANNYYIPYDNTYPILFPAMWSLLYKTQLGDQLWWVARLTLFILPIFLYFQLLESYKERKNIYIVAISLLFLPYILWDITYSGYMDVPVMIIGMMSLLHLVSAEMNKEHSSFDQRVIVGLLLAGISTITKQAGFIFLLFSIIYIALNYKRLNNKALVFSGLFVSTLYFSSFYILFIQTDKEPFGLVNGLYSITEGVRAKTISSMGFFDEILRLFDYFFTHQNMFSFYFEPILFLLSCIYYFSKGKEIEHKNFMRLLLIFSIIGFIVWGSIFSYDHRNSLWVKSFMILFTSLVINDLVTNYKLSWSFLSKYLQRLRQLTIFPKLSTISARKRYVVFIFFTIFSASLFIPKGLMIDIQSEQQSQLGNERLAIFVKNQLEKSAPCVKFYTDYQTLRYNYHLKDYFHDRVILSGPVAWKESIDKNSCKEGLYILPFPYRAKPYISDEEFELLGGTIIEIGENKVASFIK